MANLYELLKHKQQKLQRSLVEADRLNDILNRPDTDFFTYIKRDGSLGSIMRDKRCPGWIWSICKIAFQRTLKKAFR